MFPTEDLLKLIKEAGLRAQAQASFYKVAAGDLIIYVGKTQRASRVDLSGFTITHPAVKRLSDDQAKENKMGRVRGQIDFSKPQEKVIEAFRTALAVMKHEAGQGARELGSFAKDLEGVNYKVLEPRTAAEDGAGKRGKKAGGRSKKQATKSEPAAATA